jgi:hypothetical protein
LPRTSSRVSDPRSPPDVGWSTRLGAMSGRGQLKVDLPLGWPVLATRPHRVTSRALRETYCCRRCCELRREWWVFHAFESFRPPSCSCARTPLLCGSPIGTALAEGVALLLDDTLDARRALKKRMKELYGKRSAVSHGGGKAILDVEYAEMEQAAGALLVTLIS